MTIIMAVRQDLIPLTDVCDSGQLVWSRLYFAKYGSHLAFSF